MAAVFPRYQIPDIHIVIVIEAKVPVSFLFDALEEFRSYFGSNSPLILDGPTKAALVSCKPSIGLLIRTYAVVNMIQRTFVRDITKPQHSRHRVQSDWDSPCVGGLWIDLPVFASRMNTRSLLVCMDRR